MEEELEKTKQSYQTQISAHEKKAHNNWVSKTRQRFVKFLSELLHLCYKVKETVVIQLIAPEILVLLCFWHFQVAARAAERELSDFRRDNALLRQK